MGLALGWAGCALLAGACLALDPGLTCNRTQYEAHGKCCRRCPPGQKVEALCSTDDDNNTVCTPCQPGHFQDSWTLRTACTPHRYCDQNAGLVVHSQGDAERNVVCQCQSGTHCSSPECQSCRKNQACEPGQGVEQAATDMKDTVCAPCPMGFFSNLSSTTAQCQQWSSCRAVGLVQKASGTPFSDVICGEPHRTRRPALLLLPLLLVMVVVALGGVGLWCRHRRGLPKWHPEEEGHRPPGRKQPTEVDDVSPALPIQEVGKDGRLADQELACVVLAETLLDRPLP